MIAYRDGEPWVEFETPDPTYHKPVKTISLPLSVYLLAVAETKCMASLRARCIEYAGEFARSNGAKMRYRAAGGEL